MSKSNAQDQSSAAAMRDDSNDADEREEQPTPAAAVAASSSSVPAADDARSARLARRSQLRVEAGRDAPERERGRLEPQATEPGAREALRADVLAAQSVQWRSFGPAQRLFTDGIASCLGFLALADFNSSAQTCKSWRVGAHAVKSIGPLEVTALAVPPTLRSSPFRRLVKSFVASDTIEDEDLSPHRRPRRRYSWGSAQLADLRMLSGLTSMRVQLDLVKFAGAAAPIEYPPSLVTATLGLGCSRSIKDHTWDAASIVHGLAACATLTRLTLELDKESIVLTALGALQQLRHLSIDGVGTLHYTRETLHAIKTMHQLETLTLHQRRDRDYFESFERGDHDPDSTWLVPLLTQPHQLQALQSLESEDFRLWDNVVCVQLLTSLTGLTELQSSSTSVLAMPVLAAFTKLRILRLGFDGDEDTESHPGNNEVAAAYDDHGHLRLSVLVPRLARCRLTDLDLSRITCDGESLAALCSSQPLLQVLQLAWVTLSSLQPLSALRHLSQLSVALARHCDPLSQLFEQISACKSLQQLQLCANTPALSEAQQRALTPPSNVLPLLQSFHYSTRDQVDRASHVEITVSGMSSESDSPGYASESADASSESS